MIRTKPPFFGEAEPAWDIAQLFPAQGEWTEEDYLELETNRLIEFSHGHVEVLPMPSVPHQLIVRMLFRVLENFVMEHNLGEVLFAPISVQLWPGKYREPDVVFISTAQRERITQQYLIGANLVMEVISPVDRNRDVVKKRREYAQAGISEYWLVDPEQHTITVLILDGAHYVEHGVFEQGDQATSRLLAGFMVEVSAVFVKVQ
jgi:Uma2 family endonuclease